MNIVSLLVSKVINTLMYRVLGISHCHYDDATQHNEYK